MIRFVAGFVLGLTAAVAAAGWLFVHEPTEIIGADQLDSATAKQRNGLIEIHYKLVKREACNSISMLWLWRWDEPDVAKDVQRYRYILPFGYSGVTFSDVSPVVQDLVFARPAPPGLTPGPWFVRIKYLDYCSFWSPITGPVSRRARDIPINIFGPAG